VLAGRVSSLTVAALDEAGRAPEHGAYLAIYRERSGQKTGTFWQPPGVERAPARIAAPPPGDYFALASVTADPLGDFDTDALSVLRAMGTRFSVRQGETRVITVTVFPRRKR
jgi:hypothetical protein